jgi:enterochelin esterase-like enzyme
MTRALRLAIVFVLGVLLASGAVAPLFAQVTPPATAPGPPPGQLPPGINAGPNVVPKAGVCPLPILPAIPKYEDTAYYANADVPHGKVEVASYKNSAGVDTTMHVYLPPGYDAGGAATAASMASYPVLYLNHGGGGNDGSWTDTSARGGSAQFIMDNLIATGKTKLMIVVMPNTSKCASGIPSAPGKDDACTREYLTSVIPYVESHYRAKADRADRAIAGLSMGGFVVMNTGLPHLDTFSELYVYSSGYFPDQIKAFEDNFSGMLKDPATNDLFRVPFYMSAGETDIALKNGQAVMAIINKYGVRNFWVLSTGGHEWANWRRSLYQTAQIMFPECGGK